MTGPAQSVVQREATWWNSRPGVTETCGQVLPYVRRLEGSEDRQVRLRRTGSRVSPVDLGHDDVDHDLLLIVSWPLDGDLVGAQAYLDQAVDLLVTTLRLKDRTHDGLWQSSADSGGFGAPDITVTFTDPDQAVALADDGRLIATVAYSVTEHVARIA